MPIIKSKAYLGYHFVDLQALYRSISPVLSLCLTDMKETGVDKVKYHVMQVGCLPDDRIDNICSKTESGEGTVIVQKVVTIFQNQIL